MSRHILLTLSNTEFYENPSGVSLFVHTGGRTDPTITIGARTKPHGWIRELPAFKAPGCHSQAPPEALNKLRFSSGAGARLPISLI